MKERKIVDYCIITISVHYIGDDDLQKKVKDAIKDGWTPLGSPFINEYRNLFCQALVKYKD
jgi:hypothetical protein